MKVADIMTREVISVTPDTPLQEAAGLLAKFRIHGMPVLDENGKVSGIITESDFFTKDSSNIYLPTFLDFIKKEKTGDGEGAQHQDLERKTTVRDIVTPECFTVEPDLPIDKLISLFKDKNFNTVPVVDEEKKLVGIVTVMDVIKLL